MWPLPPFNKRCIIIHFSPLAITCSWFEQEHQKIFLKAYQTNKLENLELERLLIFNPSRISSMIQSFLKKHNLKNSYSVFCLSGPCVKEQFVTSQFCALDKVSQYENRAQYVVDMDHLIWDYVYLYPKDERFVFYVAGIRPEIIFQYQLLALHNKLKLISISSETMGLLALYKKCKGTEFRHSQLGTELTQYNNNVLNLFDENMLSTIIHDNNTELPLNSPTLLSSLGLYCIRNNSCTR